VRNGSITCASCWSSASACSSCCSTSSTAAYRRTCGSRCFSAQSLPSDC
jgi:hypothetical protein